MSRAHDQWLRDNDLVEGDGEQATVRESERGSDLPVATGNCLILFIALGALASSAGYGLVELIRWLV